MNCNFEMTKRMIELIDENPLAAKLLLYFIDQSDENNFADCSYLALDDFFNEKVLSSYKKEYRAFICQLSARWNNPSLF